MINVAAAFREMHNPNKPLVLPNIWDAGSARIFEDAGAPALATTSAGVCWSLGYPDSDVLPVRKLVELTANIVRVIRLPLSVDVEEGYSDDPAEVAETVGAVADAGAVGINIEDGSGTPEALVAKVEAIRGMLARKGLEVFINARTDVYLRGLVDEGKRVDETNRRAALYHKAGADGLFVPALTAANEIKAISNEVKMPLNVIAWSGLAPVAELGPLGVSRLSAGSGIPQVLWKHAAEMARDFVQTGNSTPMAENLMPHAKLQELFHGRWPNFLAGRNEEPWGIENGRKWKGTELAPKPITQKPTK